MFVISIEMLVSTLKRLGDAKVVATRNKILLENEPQMSKLGVSWA